MEFIWYLKGGAEFDSYRYGWSELMIDYLRVMIQTMIIDGGTTGTGDWVDYSDTNKNITDLIAGTAAGQEQIWGEILSETGDDVAKEGNALYKAGGAEMMV